jgi:RNA polymerase sigma factor (TIGR02999 family)
MNADDTELQARIEVLLRQNTERNPLALASLMNLLQDDIRRVAHASRISLRSSETLSTTDLINELYLKLQQNPLPPVADAGHFLSVAVRAMRQVLIDYARARNTEKRGGDLQIESLDAQMDMPNDAREAQNMLELNEALDRLEAVHPRLAKVVQLRYFAGLNDAEIGKLLDLEASSIRRDWLKARGWLFKKLS